ncbi:M28 family peptidase [Dysgonomonas sp. 25]|uniref:M28 family peptidase n=1 Tax=Dysgonomonas sp. 25 TaxID=2302933 RepID=UPI0013D13B16|nr:glutamine cyclotransferase [Dysgonomonas sp. 25]
MYRLISIALIASMVACSCGNKTTTNTSTPQAESYQQVSPAFNADLAYEYVQKQVDFGPRVPNTKEHVACGDFLVSELKRYGAEVVEQKAVLTAYNGKKLNARNIIASYGEDKQERVLLFAHWDTRPYADHDKDEKNHNTPILGANDGASGVGVLLAIAKELQTKEPNVGVDIILFDAEDYGPPAFDGAEKPGDWWCLGSQYWGKNPHVKGYTAKYGILLDMVGTKEATFYREIYSKQVAPNVVEKVWSTARQLGYGKYFISKDGGGVTDDHVYVHQYRHIPSIDIIDYKIDKKNDGFFSHWHTVNDTMENIDKETLKAVGQTVLEVIYKEN